MPKIGELYWVASVKGQDSAERAADSLEDSYQSFASTASAAASQQNQLAEKTGETREETERANRWSRRLQGTQGLLASALFFTTDQLGVTSAVMGTYTVATEAATFATGTLYAALAGPAGLAAGAATAVLGVGLLSTELLGLTDVTPVAKAETESMTGTFADMAYLIGGPLVGYLSAGFSLLTGDFEGAKNKFVNTSVEWVKAATRFASRVKLGFATVGIAAKNSLRTSIETADYAWRRGLNSLITATNGATESIYDSLVGGIGESVNGAIRQINGFLSEYNKYASQVPGMDITAGTLSGVNFNTSGRNVGRVGTVANEGLSSRVSRVTAQSAASLSAARRTAQGELAAYAPDTIGGSRRTTTPAGSSRDSPAIGEQTINIEIGDQTLDIRNLNRTERRELAQFIGDELGSSTTGIAGMK